MWQGRAGCHMRPQALNLLKPIGLSLNTALKLSPQLVSNQPSALGGSHISQLLEEAALVGFTVTKSLSVGKLWSTLVNSGQFWSTLVDWSKSHRVDLTLPLLYFLLCRLDLLCNEKQLLRARFLQFCFPIQEVYIVQIWFGV